MNKQINFLIAKKSTIVIMQQRRYNPKEINGETKRNSNNLKFLKLFVQSFFSNIRGKRMIFFLGDFSSSFTHTVLFLFLSL